MSRDLQENLAMFFFLFLERRAVELRGLDLARLASSAQPVDLFTAQGVNVVSTAAFRVPTRPSGSEA